MDDSARVESCIRLFEDNRTEISYFADNVKNWLEKCDSLHDTGSADIYSVKSRLKDVGHLRKKLERKPDVNPDNFFARINDLAGVRVLHLWPSQFNAINVHIQKRLGDDWRLHEDPMAYTWDPETRRYFEQMNIKVEEKDSYYTSVHYVVSPNNDNASVSCEIQVRSLLEEVWGEVDHSINYPDRSSNRSCTDQLLVLAKLIGAGTRLISSIEASFISAIGESRPLSPDGFTS